MALLEMKDLKTFFTTKRGVVKAVNGVSFNVELLHMKKGASRKHERADQQEDERQDYQKRIYSFFPSLFMLFVFQSRHPIL